MRRKRIITAVFVTLIMACSAPAEKAKNIEVGTDSIQKKEVTDAETLVGRIEESHGKSKFNLNEVVQFDLKLMFGGKERFNGRMYIMTDGSKIKMEDALTLKYWDGNKAMVLPSEENEAKARFDLLTWSYFFTAPYKLSDAGTNHEYLGQLNLGGSEFEANKLTFNQGVGDTPDDWYIVYKDNNSDLLAAMAYIVTSGETAVAEAEKNPHIITYEAYTDVGGIPIATQWNFWTWNQEGEMNELLGSATVSNVEFINKAGDLFNLTAL